MSSPRLTTLHIELEVDAEPIAGHVRDEDDVRHPFTGWLEFVQAIERRRQPTLPPRLPSPHTEVPR